MPKRPSQSAASSTPKAKKPRNNGKGQLQLDNFLTSPSKKGTPSVISQKAQPVTIDVDALDDDEAAWSPGSSALSAPSVPSASQAQPPVQGTSRSPRKTTLVFGAKAVKPERLVFHAIDTDPVFYVPQDQPWTSSDAPYSFLAHTFATLSQTRSRIAIINSLTNTLRTILERHPPSLLPALYLLSNSLSPPYVGIELGIGSSVISKAIQQVSGLSAAALKQLYTTTGDVGDVAFEAKSKVRTLVPHPPLTIEQVYDSLLKISACKGQGAAKTKEKVVEELLVAGSGEEVRFLVRTLTLNLRVGAVRTSILTALARASVLHGPPTNLSNGDKLSGSLYPSKDLLQRIQPLPTDPKKKGSADAAREELKLLFTKAESLVKQVYVRHPCYDDIVKALLDSDLVYLAERVPLSVGIPLHPTLGSPTRSLDEIYERLGDLPFSAEFKYDGQRAQIHAKREESGQVVTKIFSRHLEDMTTKYPDVIFLIEELLRITPSINSVILDAEIVAIDPVTEELKSFQELSNRARKDVQLSDIKVTVSVFAFDMLYLNGEARQPITPLTYYLQRTFRERRQALKTNFPPHSPADTALARLRHVESCESDDGQVAVQEFWERALESRCEGLMVKVLDYEPVEPGEGAKLGVKSRRKDLPATYEPDKRTSAWLKLKKDYVDTIGDSLDLVPIGAWYGNGRKAGWWSPILLGLWGPETGRPVAICKCMSGFTDAFYKSLLERYRFNSDACSQKPEWDVDFGGFRPDVYFRPSEVWEIRGADITESPVSVAARGLVSETRGLSLRFPRFIKSRDDKAVEQASTPGFLASLWRKQQKAPTGGVGGVDDGDLIDADAEESDEFDEEEENDSEEELALALLLLGGLAQMTPVRAEETVYDAARIARNLVERSTTSIGSMATTFPSEDPDLPSFPFSMQEYYASCHSNGSLTLLFLPISRHSRNVLHASSHSASISVTSTVPAASRPRVSLLGNITVFTDIHSVPDREVIQECYLEKHRDAKWWLPDDEGAAHISYWARFDPKAVYFVGGFGGLHYIGWIPLDIYQHAKHTPDNVDTAAGSGSQAILD